VACSKKSKTTAELQRQGLDEIAIDGYWPVSSYTKGAAEKGSPDYAVSYDGLTTPGQQL
jgi:hypothetical protein